MIHRIAHWIATCGPVGYLKFAPGTFGSLVGLVLVLIAASHITWFIVFLLVLILLGIWSSGIASRGFGNHDPSEVVIDEVCGMMISFLAVPISFWAVLIGFIGFRFFDIVKPQPIRWLEHFPEGFGIVLDDLLAGIYTNVILQILVRYAHL